jgi:hypothetical protein
VLTESLSGAVRAFALGARRVAGTHHGRQLRRTRTVRSSRGATSPVWARSRSNTLASTASGGAPRASPDGVEDGVLAQPCAEAVACVGDAVGEQDEDVPLRVPAAGHGAGGEVHHPERRRGRGEALSRAALTDDEGVRVAGVRVPELARGRVDDGVERGDEHLGARQLLLERAEDGAEHLRRVAAGLRVDGRRAHRQRHDERGAVPVARHVADHHARAPAGRRNRW